MNKFYDASILTYVHTCVLIIQLNVHILTIPQSLAQLHPHCHLLWVNIHALDEYYLVV